jgi:glycosyltransferase involved in cell wall biosynthesis
MDISVILPIHNEQENLPPLMEELRAALAPLDRPYEIIAVDDGSTDESLQVLRRLASSDEHLRVIRFRGNFGQSAAFDAGFRAATGKIVVTMDADRQNDPADIPRMIQAMENGDYDFVAGRRADRKDAFVLRRFPSVVANFIIRRVTGTRLRDLGCSLKVYRRQITDELRLYGEMHRFLGVLVESTGARTTELNVNHRPRPAGKSKYGITRTFKVLLDLLTVWFMRGYQTKPIYVFGGIGLALGAISTILLAIVAWQRLVNHIYVHLQPLFTIAMIFSVMAVQFLGMGLIAEIVVRTYFESRQKSSYLVAEMMGFEQADRAVDDKPHPELTYVAKAPPRIPERLS